MDIQVDPNLMNEGYKRLLAESQARAAEQTVLLQAACTQLQAQVQTLTEENEELKLRLNQETGRQDGVPQDEPPAELD